MAHRPSPCAILEPAKGTFRTGSESEQTFGDLECDEHFHENGDGEAHWVPRLDPTKERIPRCDGKRFQALINELVEEFESVRLNKPRTIGHNAFSVADHQLMMSAVSSLTQTHKPRPIENWSSLAQRMMRIQSAGRVFELRDCWQFRSFQQSSAIGVHAEVSPGIGTDIVQSVWTRRTQSWVRKAPGRSYILYDGDKWVGPVIHPDSLLHLVWVLCGLLFIISDIFYFSMSVFGLSRSSVVQLLDCIYWSLDVGMNFRLGYHSRDRVVLNPTQIAKVYLRGWFVFDFGLMLAGWLLSFLVDGHSGTGMLRYFRFVRLTRLLRVSKFTTSIHELAFRVQTDIGTLALRTVSYMFVVGIWIHINACLFYWIGNHQGGWAYDLLGDTTIALKYIISVHWAASQLQGGIDVYPNFLLGERIYAVMSLLGSVAILALVISKITTLLSAIQATQKERNLAFNTAHRFATQKGVRAEVLLEVYRYLGKRKRYQVRQEEINAERDLFARLPFSLRRRLLEEARWPQLRNRTIFMALSNSSKHFITQLLCDILQNVMHLPDQLVFQYGALCPRIYIVVSGDGHYTKYAKTFAALLSGESFIHTGLGGTTDLEKHADLEYSQAESRDPALSAGFSKEAALPPSLLDQGERSQSTQPKRGTKRVSTAKNKAELDRTASGSSAGSEFDVFEDRHKQLQGVAVLGGEMLCEVALWTSWLHVGDFEAVGELGLFTINISSFSDLVASFPSVQKNFRLHAQRVIRYLRAADDTSDLLTTDEIMTDPCRASVSEQKQT